jgi:hypothetical protein
LPPKDQDHDTPPPDGGSELISNTGQSSTQEIETVETHTFQGSEGRLRKPTVVVKAEVIAAFTPEGHNKVFARSDDLLALQAENRLDLDLSGKAEVISSLKQDLGPDFRVSKSKDHPNCSLVRPVNPEPSPDSPALQKFKARQREMLEIEHFLEKDWNFCGLVTGLSCLIPGPSPEREAWLTQYFRKVYRHHNFKGDQSLFNSRCRAVCDYIKLWDEERQDEEGASENMADIKRIWGSSHDVPGRGYVYSSLYPYNLGQCERTSGPSHVEDGGGDALEPAPMCCENPLGPSPYTGDATQRSPDQGMDRSSPLQSTVSPAESDSHNVDTDSEDSV